MVLQPTLDVSSAPLVVTFPPSGRARWGQDHDDRLPVAPGVLEEDAGTWCRGAGFARRVGGAGAMRAIRRDRQRLSGDFGPA